MINRTRLAAWVTFMAVIWCFGATEGLFAQNRDVIHRKDTKMLLVDKPLKGHRVPNPLRQVPIINLDDRVFRYALITI